VAGVSQASRRLGSRTETRNLERAREPASASDSESGGHKREGRKRRDGVMSRTAEAGRAGNQAEMKAERERKPDTHESIGPQSSGDPGRWMLKFSTPVKWRNHPKESEQRQALVRIFTLALAIIKDYPYLELLVICAVWAIFLNSPIRPTFRDMHTSSRFSSIQYPPYRQQQLQIKCPDYQCTITSAQVSSTCHPCKQQCSIHINLDQVPFFHTASLWLVRELHGRHFLCST
jgi:hypothetical protein